MKQEIKQRIEQIKNGEVPNGYKKTKIGIVPNEWEINSLKNITIQLDEKAGERIFETLSITAGKGFVNQAEKFGKELSGKQYVNYTVINKGDFSYNKGNSKKYPQGCVYMLEDRECAAVPNVFNSFRLKNQCNEFFKQLFIDGFLNKQLYKYINSGVRNDGLLNLYDRDFYSCKVLIPPLNEQQKISDILSTQDRVIELKEKLLKEKEKRKKYLMQILLTGRKRLKGFNGEWKKYNFENIFRVIASNKYQIKKNEYLVEGVYPVIDQGKKEIVGYSNNEEKVLKCPQEGIIVFGDHTCCLKFIDFDFIVGADGTQLLSSKSDEFLNIFLYYYLSNKKIINDGYSRHFKYIKEFVYTLPKFEEQKAIAEILTTADKELKLLQEELEEEKRKKKALMQLLLTGIVRVKV